jgi:hypothetical protein
MRIATRNEHQWYSDRNFLAHFFDNDLYSLYLYFISLNQIYTYPELVKKIGTILHKDESEARLIASQSIDCLIDCGVLRPLWERDKDRSGCFRKKFKHRGELMPTNIDEKMITEEDLSLRPSDPNFLESARKIHNYIFFKGDTIERWDARVERVKRELTIFIEKVIKKAEDLGCSLIAPLARKGETIADELLAGRLPSSIKRVSLYRLETGKCKEKRVLVIDDATCTGRTIKDVRTRLVGKVKRCYFASYIVDPKCSEQVRSQIVEYKLAKTREEFHREVRDILLFLETLGSVMDRDHLEININLEGKITIDETKEALKKTADVVLEPNFDYLHPLRKKITIERRFDKDKKPNRAIEIDQCKLRVVSNLNSEDYSVDSLKCVPIVNPLIEVDAEMSGCKDDKLSYRFCDRLRESPPLPHPCIDCIVYNMVSSFAIDYLGDFIGTLLTDHKVTVRSVESRFDYLKDRYDFFDKFLYDFDTKLKEKIEKSRHS